jgi:hypothetical protein
MSEDAIQLVRRKWESIYNCAFQRRMFVDVPTEDALVACVLSLFFNYVFTFIHLVPLGISIIYSFQYINPHYGKSPLCRDLGGFAQSLSWSTRKKKALAESPTKPSRRTYNTRQIGV